MSSSHSAFQNPHVEITLIRPASSWTAIGLKELWEYRELLYFLTWRDVKVRYKQTALGAAWLTRAEAGAPTPDPIRPADGS